MTNKRPTLHSHLTQLVCMLIVNMFVASFPAMASEIVRVGVTHFPPFYDVHENGEVHGLGIDVINALNTIQSDYLFQPVPASPLRRHAMFHEGRFDMSFFDHVVWGWDREKVESTPVYLTGGEVFITLKDPSKNQSYFTDIEKRSIAAIRGYHYRFTNFETDPKALHKRFNITLTNSPDHIIKLVEEKRVDIGIVTETYLLKYFQKHFTARAKFLTSNSYDQRYNFTTIVRKGFTPSAQKMNDLMKQVRTDPRFKWIKDTYGLDW